MGNILRKRKRQKSYTKHLGQLNSKKCDFCTFSTNDKQIIKGYEYFWVVRNIFGYDIWDSYKVKKHLMIVPKRHVRDLGEFSLNETTEYMRLVKTYEKQGYSSFTRSYQAGSRSVAHSHTHLIKTGGKPLRGVMYLRKPHFLLYK